MQKRYWYFLGDEITISEEEMIVGKYIDTNT
jgi:hypothetical protein